MPSKSNPKEPRVPELDPEDVWMDLIPSALNEGCGIYARKCAGFDADGAGRGCGQHPETGGRRLGQGIQQCLKNL